MRTWHFLQQSSKLWRMWKPDWRPGSTRLETPSCIIRQVRRAGFSGEALVLGGLTPNSAYGTPIDDWAALTGNTALLLWSSDMQSCLKKSFFLFFFSFSFFGPCSFVSDCKVWSCSVCHWEAHYLYYRSTCLQEPKLFPVWSVLFMSAFLSLFILCFCSKSAASACWSLGCYRKTTLFWKLSFLFGYKCTIDNFCKPVSREKKVLLSVFLKKKNYLNFIDFRCYKVYI